MRTWRGDDPDCKDKLTDDGYKVYDKVYGRSLTEETIRRGFEEYFQLGEGEKAARGLIIRRVVNKMIYELEALQEVLEQEESRMYSASLLFIYEGDVESLQAAFKSDKAARQAVEQTLEKTPADANHDHEDAATTTDGDLGASQVLTGIEPSVLRAIQAANLSPKENSFKPNVNGTLQNGTTPLVLSSTDLSTEDSEDDPDSPPQKTTVLKLIDFAHAQWTPGQGPDENVLHGIRNVIKVLETFL